MNMPISLEEVTEYLHAELPLTRAMGARIIAWDQHAVTVTAPLAPNINHTDFAFGGSISSLAILAAYSLLYLLFQEKNVSTRILIQKSTTEYLRPIDTELLATAATPEPAQLEEFLQTLTRKRRARISLDSKIFTQQSLAATHTGLFIAMIY